MVTLSFSLLIDRQRLHENRSREREFGWQPADSSKKCMRLARVALFCVILLGFWPLFGWYWIQGALDILKRGAE
jgi:hypothetical protein